MQKTVQLVEKKHCIPMVINESKLRIDKQSILYIESRQNNAGVIKIMIHQLYW